MFAFRTIDDTRGMIDYVTRDDHRRAVVIGGGLLGLEAARGLQGHGIEVDVVHSGRWLMNAQLGREGGEVLRRSMAELGIGIFTNNRATTIWGPDKVQGVRLRDETEIDCDLVVVAAGIRPNTDVATTSGFTVERAIVVDDQMRTVDDDHVFAVGECVQHRGEVYGLVAPWEQAVVLADVITGNNPQAAYLGSRTATKLKVAGVEVAAMGLTEPSATPMSTSSSPSRSGGLQVGGDPRRQGRRRDPARRQQEAGFPAAGLRSWPAAAGRAGGAVVRPGGPPAEVGVAELADDAQICNCNGVCKSTIVDTVKGMQDGLRCHGGHPSWKRLWLVQRAGRATGRIRRRWRR